MQIATLLQSENWAPRVKRGALFNPDTSESKLGRELNSARAAAAEERIANADIAGGGQRIEACVAASHRIWFADVRRKVRHDGIGKIRMVEQVEKFGAQLQIQSLGDGSVLE